MVEQTAASQFAHGAAARSFGENNLRPGLLEYGGQFDRGKKGIDQHGNDTELHSREKCDGEFRRVAHLDENEIAALQAQGDQTAGHGVHALLQCFVSDDPAVTDERRPRAAPARNRCLEHIIRKIQFLRHHAIVAPGICQSDHRELLF